MLKTVFRYPGGKTKLAKNIISEIDLILNDSSIALGGDDSDDFTFIDPFVGGGSISLGVMSEFPNATTLILNDMDDLISSFWLSMLEPRLTEKIIQHIEQYRNPSVEAFKHLRSLSKQEMLETTTEGFMALFFNRTAFSGILKSGPMGGYEQKGKYKIDCRYNADKLISSIRNISEVMQSKDIKLWRRDFRVPLNKYIDDTNCFVYLDPPYMAQGKQLYNCFMQYDDYVEMAEILKKAKFKWLLSHDDNPELIKLFEGWANIKSIEGVAYTINSIKGKKRTELLISA